MCRVLEPKGRFNILQTSRDYVVVNTELKYENHAHMNKLEHAIILIKLIDKGILPHSKYWRTAARRLLDNKEYSQLRVKKKEKYINISKS